MFKIKVNKKVGDAETVVEVETTSEDMVLAILRHNDVISIDSDVENKSVDEAWLRLIRDARNYNLETDKFVVTC